MSVVDGSYDNPLKVEEEASAPLAGGIMNHGFQCGMLWGASLAAGAEAYRRFGSGPQAEAAAIRATERLMETFQGRTQNEINCTEIAEINFQEVKGIMPILKYFVKGGKVGPGACFRLAAGYGPDAAKTIDAALSEEPIEAPTLPISCAAVLAKKMGASDMHAVMASGFAGGISFSGGGCGALGAAIWLTAMNGREEGTSKMGYFNEPGYMAVIDRFVECTDAEFECCEIVGRKFENTADHAEYLRAGGCAEIIEAMAAQPAE
jgi:hypothetical protein